MLKLLMLIFHTIVKYKTSMTQWLTDWPTSRLNFRDVSAPKKVSIGPGARKKSIELIV